MKKLSFDIKKEIYDKVDHRAKTSGRSMASTGRELVMMDWQYFAQPLTTDTARDNLAPRTTSPDYYYHLISLMISPCLFESRSLLATYRHNGFSLTPNQSPLPTSI